MKMRNRELVAALGQYDPDAHVVIIEHQEDGDKIPSGITRVTEIEGTIYIEDEPYD